MSPASADCAHTINAVASQQHAAAKLPPDPQFQRRVQSACSARLTKRNHSASLELVLGASEYCSQWNLLPPRWLRCQSLPHRRHQHRNGQQGRSPHSQRHLQESYCQTKNTLGEPIGEVGQHHNAHNEERDLWGASWQGDITPDRLSHSANDRFSNQFFLFVTRANGKIR